MLRVDPKILFAIMLGFLIGALSAVGIHMAQQNLSRTGIVLQDAGKAEIGGPFRLVDQAGHEFTEQQLRGRPSLIVFGYTGSDITPGALNVISQAFEATGTKAEAVRVVFISLDWERDTPDVLKTYLQRFHPNIIGLSGSEEEIRGVASAFKVFLEKETSTDSSIRINHSQLVIALDSDATYVSLLRLPTSVAAVVALLNNLLA